MATLPVPSGRAKFEDDGLLLRVSMPPRRNVFLMLFVAAWLGGWYFGETSALGELTKPGGVPDHGFMLFWLFGWSLGGLFVAYSLLWMAFGREVVELRPDSLIHSRRILGVGRNRAYDITAVKDLRLGPETPDFFSFNRSRSGRWGDVWGLSGGPIVFDYGAKTLRCGASLDEAEAKIVIARLRARNPRLRQESAA